MEERPGKKARIAGPGDCFAKGLLDTSEEQSKAYAASEPYQHACIPQLFDDDLLHAVKAEILANLVFTEKETDIYKVRQTGDLANLDGLEQSEKQKLKYIAQVREALYSVPFRTYLRKVTGVGPLSGSKIDMSINNYTQGCHLLNHDDVIGTRSVSYILYLPDEGWQPTDGGALELYPVKTKGIPVDEPSLTLPPSWNQFIFFAVQPGHSFHSVEEVVSKKNRLSISGWFHVAQPGEEGYDARATDLANEEEAKAKSTLEQLLATDDAQFDAYPESTEFPDVLSEEALTELSTVMNPQYLSPVTLKQVNEQFCNDSYIQLSSILRKDLADKLKKVLVEADAHDKIDGSIMTPHGTGVGNGWKVEGPPHRHRYLRLASSSEVPPDAAADTLRQIEKVVASDAFRTWLALVTALQPESRFTCARRFRPGLDYTLATANQRLLLDVNLCLTPAKPVWEEGEVGGYLCFMAPHGDEDAAVYKASADDEEDGVLLTAHAAWNEMTIVMRDTGVLSFTKYVAVASGASRWDIAGQYPVAD
ncbi:Oxoglutarate and iron-dependent oxygenase degradation C-term-domain-containing protein [Protomyces lactucae-debilis]|uniref:uS12 prolyl 3,4-dihydroxylase n=1 Tax=Protomyces lactucae-debilis TaxID=2754530 RepID=A0A1Y2FR90_PROLT|nr:Oxoglutarate and iron-dependent oxygenase degradation C-term-domain-containing protein [Protomyces lactucae-debilis]ORY85716.1 Oxoglutarate and iron-dependent oxygenase degradation C-term-domain-containing protein [Protomyces lactucae-debilis]